MVSSKNIKLGLLVALVGYLFGSMLRLLLWLACGILFGY